MHLSEIIYNVSLENLDALIEKIFTEIPEKVQRELFDEVVWNVETSLKVAAPKKSGGLSDSIRTDRIGKFDAFTGPTKKVDGYDLGSILEVGSKGGQILTPRTKSYMKFRWRKTGATHYFKSVTRGAIAPRRWVRNTVRRIVPEIKRIVYNRWRDEYARNAT